jgi:hypothetical protein
LFFLSISCCFYLSLSLSLSTCFFLFRRYVISIGERDRAVAVWKVLNNEEDAPEIPRQQYTGQVSSRPGTSSGPSNALVPVNSQRK